MGIAGRWRWWWAALLCAGAACSSPVAGQKPGLVDAQADAGYDSGLADLTDVVDATDGLPDLLADALVDAVVVNDASGKPDVPADIAAEVSPCNTYVAPITTIGTPGPLPMPCVIPDCGKCPAPYQCTCTGDGQLPCAWAPMAPMHHMRYRHAAVWGEGKLYVWGGENSTEIEGKLTLDPDNSAGVLATGEVWDPVTNAWTLLPQAPVFPSTSPTLVWGDGRLYLTGKNYDHWQPPPVVTLPWGPDFADYAVYDPKTNQWSALPKKGSPGGCGDGETIAWLGGKLIEAGCMGGFPIDPNKPASAYDPKTDTWTPLPPVPPPGEAALTRDYGGGRVLGDKLVFWNPAANDNVGTYPGAPGGGVVYDSVSGIWTVFPAPPCAPQMLPWSAVAFDAGVAYWGYIGPNDPAYEAAYGSGYGAWLRWVNKGTWETLALPDWMAPKQNIQLAWTGKYLIFWQPGFASGLYDPEAHTWRPMPKLFEPEQRANAAVSVHDNQLFAIGGQLLDIGPVHPVTKTAGRLLLTE